MKRHGRRRRGEVRSRTRPTLSRLRMAVVTNSDASTEKADVGRPLRQELDMVKASLLYADEVVLVSPAVEVINQIRRMSGSADALASLAGHWLLADESAPINSLEWDWTDYVELLELDDADLNRARGFDIPPDELQRRVALVDSALADKFLEMQETLEFMHQESGLGELDQAIARGLVRLSLTSAYNYPLGEGPVEAEDIVTMQAREDEAFAIELNRYLQDPNIHLVVDDHVAAHVKGLIDAGFKTSAHTRTNAMEALLQSGFVGNLNAFTQAGVDELLDLRDDLEAPLVRYRSSVASLGESSKTGPFDEERHAEVAARWKQEVAPALLELSEQLADHGLIREMIGRSTSDIKSLASGGVITVGQLLHGVDPGLVAYLPGIATAGVVGTATGLVARSAARRAASRQDFFYLYQLNRQLS